MNLNHVRLIALFALIMFSGCVMMGTKRIENPNLISKNRPDLTGPHQVKSYTAGLASKDYSTAIVHYPVGKGPFPVTSISGGWNMNKEQMFWLSAHLASHGFITITFTQREDVIFADTKLWSDGHLGCLNKIKEENKQPESPVCGKVDTNNMGIIGFSMGGSATIDAAAVMGPEVKAAIALAPKAVTQHNITAATMVITGSADTEAIPFNVKRGYNRIPSSTIKAFVTIKEMTHHDWLDSTNYQAIARKLITSWHKVHLASDSSFQTYISGTEHQNDVDAGLYTEYIYKPLETSNIKNSP
jgi:predicted dienelactone hydrolase